MQQMLADEAPAVWLYMPPNLVVSKKGVTGLWKDLPVPSLALSEGGWQKRGHSPPPPPPPPAPGGGGGKRPPPPPPPGGGGARTRGRPGPRGGGARGLSR